MENSNENKMISENESEIDIEKLDDFYEENSKEAEDILKDEGKMEKFLQKLEKKLKTVPVAGNVLAYVPLLMSLVRSYVKKEYTETPVTSMVSIVIALIYFLSPIDIIPDFIVGVGYIDDAAIITGCLALVRTDLEDYRKWRKENGLEVDEAPNYEDIAKQAQQNSKIIKAFFKGQKSVRQSRK